MGQHSGLKFNRNFDGKRRKGCQSSGRELLELISLRSTGVPRKRQDGSASSSGEKKDGNDGAVETIDKPRCRQAHFFSDGVVSSGPAVDSDAFARRMQGSECNGGQPRKMGGRGRTEVACRKRPRRLEIEEMRRKGPGQNRNGKSRRAVDEISQGPAWGSA